MSDKDTLRAVAEAARQKATEAAAAATAAGGTDEKLNTASSDAEAAAVAAEDAFKKAPSHDTRSERPKSEKIKKRMEILRADLRAALIAEGKDPDEMSDLEIEAAEQRLAEDDEEGARPVTHADLSRMGIVKTAETMADEIQDEDTKQAVKNALRVTVSKSLPPAERYAAAVAIAASSRNTRVAQEAVRIGQRRIQAHGSGGGAPPRDGGDGGDFVPTPLEASYLKRGKLTKEDILASRKQAARMDFGEAQ